MATDAEGPFSEPSELRPSMRARVYGALGLLRAGEEPRKVRAWGALTLASLELGAQVFGLIRNPEIALAFVYKNPLTALLPLAAFSLARSARSEQRAARGWGALALGFLFLLDLGSRA